MTDNEPVTRNYLLDDSDIEFLLYLLDGAQEANRDMAESLRDDLAAQKADNRQGYRVALTNGNNDLYPKARSVAVDARGYLLVKGYRQTLAVYTVNAWNEAHAVAAEQEEVGHGPDPAS